MIDYNLRKKARYRSPADLNPERCVFCDLNSKYLIYDNGDVVLTVNLFPYINGHLLIIPKRHIEKLSEYTDAEMMSVKKLAILGETLLSDVFGFKNCWLFTRFPPGKKAGKSVAHAHFHIVPNAHICTTFDYQHITLPPIEVATKLRRAVK